MVLGKLILYSEQILALVITMVLMEMMKVDSKKLKKKRKLVLFMFYIINSRGCLSVAKWII